MLARECHNAIPGRLSREDMKDGQTGRSGGHTPSKRVKLGMAIAHGSMVKNMRSSLLAVFLLLLIAATACGESEKAEPEEDKAVPGGKPLVEQVDPAAAPLGLQAVIGEPVRIPGEVLPPLIGEPPLDGSIVITFKSVVRATTIDSASRALAGGARPPSSSRGTVPTWRSSTRSGMSPLEGSGPAYTLTTPSSLLTDKAGSGTRRATLATASRSHMQLQSR